jgi:hypothetical protein
MNSAIKHNRQASKFGAVLVSDLTIDQQAQRKLSMPWVKAHIDQFDVDQLGYIVVNRRADGKLYVVDGPAPHGADARGWMGAISASMPRFLTASPSAKKRSCSMPATTAALCASMTTSESV